MKTILSTLLFFSVGFVTPCLFHATAAIKKSKYSNSAVKSIVAPIIFELNEGQVSSEVRYLSRVRNQTLLLTANEIIVTGNSGKLTTKLIGSNTNVRVLGIDQMMSKSNYFIGTEKSKWRTDVPHYSKVKYESIYQGIDLVYYGNEQELEYDFVVSPSSDPGNIRMSFDGAKQIAVNSQGDLVLTTDKGEFRHHKPIIYQEIQGVRREIEGRFLFKDVNQVGFEIGQYDRAETLIIDPRLSFSTYISGSGVDNVVDIAVNSDGYTVVTGHTNSADFQTTVGGYQTVIGGQNDIFVVKFAPDGGLVFATYIGGTSHDYGRAITFDSDDNIYIHGMSTGADFPTTENAYSKTLTGSRDMIVTKLNPTGSSLIYSTYLGGGGSDGNENGMGIVVDSQGYAYLCGATNSVSFPTTSGAYEEVSSFSGSKGYITKLNKGGSDLVYSTYLSVNGMITLEHLAIDESGNVYVVGNSSIGETTINYNVSVVKLNEDFRSLGYSKVLDGNSIEWATGITLDNAGKAYVVGYTASSDFPTTPDAYQSTLFGDYDGFFTKLDTSGAVTYSTLFGGDARDIITDVSLDSSNNIYITGDTTSTDLPVTSDSFQSTLDGNSDAIVVIFTSDLSLAYCTYFGGSGDDLGNDIELDDSNNIYVGGYTASSNFPILNNAQSYVGSIEGFLFKLSPYLVPIYDSNPSPGSMIDFGEVELNEHSSQILTISNTGTETLSITNIALSGVDASQFDLNSDAFSIDAGGASHALTVSCTPSAVGQKTATLTVTHNAEGSPANYILTCIGTSSSNTVTSSSVSKALKGTFSPEKIVTSEFVLSTSDQTYIADGIIPTGQSIPYSFDGISMLASKMLPTTLGGINITVTDSAGTQYASGIFTVTPTRVSWLMPAGLADGPATTTFYQNGRVMSTESIIISRIMPGIFTSNSTGEGRPVGMVLRTKKNMEQTLESIQEPPIDLGEESDELILVLCGTGFRHFRNKADIKATIGGKEAEVYYSGLVPDYQGMDQINLRIPRELVNQGEVPITISFGGKMANTITVSIK